jgi:hypothetical protein
MKFTNNTFCVLDRSMLVKVAGGAARVTGRSGAADKETLSQLTQVGDALKGLSSQKPAMDPMMMMMMVMMMGGSGGGGGAPAAVAAPPPPPPAAPVVRISNSIR